MPKGHPSTLDQLLQPQGIFKKPLPAKCARQHKVDMVHISKGRRNQRGNYNQLLVFQQFQALRFNSITNIFSFVNVMLLLDPIEKPINVEKTMMKQANKVREYKILMSVARKYKLDKIKLCRTSKHVEEIVQQDKKKFYVWDQQQHIAESQQVQYYNSAQPQDIQIIQGLGETYFIKGEIRGNECGQAYEIQDPFIISDLKNVFVNEFTFSMCALANEPGGGSLLICQQYVNTTILRGIRKITWKDRKKLKENIENVLKYKNIQVQVQTLPIYQNLKQRIEQKISEQFIIKIKVSPITRARNFYSIKHKVSQLQVFNMYYKIEKNIDQNKSKYFVRKVQGLEIYQWIKNSYHNTSNIMRRVSKIQKQASKFIFGIENLVQSEEVKTIDLSYFFTKDFKQLLCKFNTLFSIQKIQQLTLKLFFESHQPLSLVSLLKKISKLPRQKIQDQFNGISQNQITVQFELRIKFDPEEKIRKIKKLLTIQKKKFKFFVPLQNIQNEHNSQENSDNPKPLADIICYFAFEGSFNEFRQDIQELFGNKLDDRVMISLVHENITTVKPISVQEVVYFQNFMWHYLYSIPEIKRHKYKSTTKQKNSKSDSYKQFMILIFKRINITATVFAFFLLTLTKKRPF